MAHMILSFYDGAMRSFVNTDTFSLYLGAPSLGHHGHLVFFAQDTFYMRAAVRNFGIGDALGVQGRLTGTGGGITMVDSVVTIGDVAAETLKSYNATPSFVFTLTDSAMIDSVEFRINLTDHLSKTYINTFHVHNVSPPESLSYRVAFDVLRLDWNTVPEATGYVVYRAANVPSAFVRQNMDPVIGAFEDRQVTPGVTYYYYVQAVDQNWNESEASGMISAMVHDLEGGWPQDVPGAHRTSVLVCDLDPTYPGLEVIQGSLTHGLAYAFHADGTPLSGWPAYITGEFWGSPAAGDIDGDDTLEVVMSTWKKSNWDMRKKVYAFEYDGSYVDGWPVLIKSGDDGFYEGCFESPVIADIDNDGDLEVIQKNVLGHIFIWQGDGSGYEYTTSQGDTVGLFFDLPENGWSYSKPVVGDILENGTLEIVVGSSSGSGGLYALDYQGNVLPGFPVQVGAHRVYSRLAIADFEPDSQGLEIAFIQAVNGEKVQHVYIVTCRGSVLPGWPVDEVNDYDLLAFSNPSAGDVDSDGVVELCLNNDDYVSCYEKDGSYVTGFPYPLEYGLENFSSLLVGNVYGSDNQIFFGGGDKYLYGIYGDTTAIPGFPIFLETYVYGTPTLTDLDQDGNVDLVASCLNGIYVFDLEEPYDPLNMDWPMFQHDIGRTGCTETPLERMNSAENAGWVKVRFSLLQNVPNPFRGGTDISFVLPQKSDVRLSVYDISGRVVNRLLSGELESGTHRVGWDGRDMKDRRLPQGVYFYRLESEGRTATKKAILLR
jgi:hypothetical protein